MRDSQTMHWHITSPFLYLHNVYSKTGPPIAKTSQYTTTKIISQLCIVYEFMLILSLFYGVFFLSLARNGKDREREKESTSVMVYRLRGMCVLYMWRLQQVPM